MMRTIGLESQGWFICFFVEGPIGPAPNQQLKEFLWVNDYTKQRRLWNIWGISYTDNLLVRSPFALRAWHSVITLIARWVALVFFCSSMFLRSSRHVHGSSFKIYDLDVSENSGTPKSSIWIGFSIIFTILFGVPLLLKTPICQRKALLKRIVLFPKVG